LEEVIPGTLNHGFGSSTAEEQLYYYPRAVKPYVPRAIVHRTYGNDVLFGYSPQEILFLVERLLEYARTDFPGIKFYLMGPEANHGPNSRLESFFARKIEYDELLRDYARHHEDCIYVSIMDSPLFFEKPEDIRDFRKIRKDIFIEDGVHFNKLGYELFTIFWKDILKDIL